MLPKIYTKLNCISIHDLFQKVDIINLRETDWKNAYHNTMYGTSLLYVHGVPNGLSKCILNKYSMQVWFFSQNHVCMLWTYWIILTFTD